MEDNKLKGFAIKEKNDVRISMGIHREGLSNLLSLFSVSDELKTKVISDCKEWVNVSLIRREHKHPAGFSHFMVGELKRKGGLDNG